MKKSIAILSMFGTMSMLQRNKPKPMHQDFKEQSDVNQGKAKHNSLQDFKFKEVERRVPAGCKRFRFLNTEGDEIFTTIAVSKKSADKKFQKFLKQNGLKEV